LIGAERGDLLDDGEPAASASRARASRSRGGRRFRRL